MKSAKLTVARVAAAVAFLSFVGVGAYAVVPRGSEDLSESQLARPTDSSASAKSSSDLRAIDASRAESPYPDNLGSLSAELAHDFQSVEQISGAASAIIVGRVTSREFATFAGMPFTVSTVKVLTSLKGPFADDQLITVVETGGVHAGASKDVPGEVGEPREVGFEGVPVMGEGEDHLLFLTGPAHVGPVESGAYSVAGVFQGKVRLSRDGYLQFTGPAAEADNELFSVPLSLDGRPVEAVVAEIRNSLR